MKHCQDKSGIMTSQNESWSKMTIPEMLEVSVRKYPDHEAVVYGDTRITFIQLKELVNIAIEGFLSLGVVPGDHVAFILGNYPDFVWLQYAVIFIGAKVIPINVSLKADEIKFILQKTDVSTLIIMDQFRGIDYLSILEQITPKYGKDEPGKLNDPSLPRLKNIVIYSQKGIDFPNAYTVDEIMKLKSCSRPLPKLNPDDYAYIMYTSGTTAFPKGSMQSHRAILGGGYYYGKGIELTSDDRYLCVSPFFHIGGLISGLFSCQVHGVTLHLTEFFQADEAAQIIAREKITAAWGLGIMFLRIMESAQKLGLDISSLKKALIPTGGNTFEQVFKELKIKVASNAFGMTEATGVISITMPDDPHWDKRRDSQGKPLPGIEIRIVDHETRKPLGHNEIGEICFRGWNKFMGYYNMPEETAAATDDQGFFYTGDMGYFDEEGYLYWSGRYKYIVKTGGENVSQEEVERFLEDKTPWVKRAGVVGIRDPRWGEAVTAIVELKPGKVVTAEEIRSYMKGKLADFKIPKHIIFIDRNEWPLRPTKKLDKMELRDMAIRNLGIGL